MTLDQTLEYVYGTKESERTVYASSENMRSTLTDLPQWLDAHDLRRYRDMSVTCGMISAFNLTTNLEISDLHFTAPTGSIVRLNGFTLTIRSPKHKNGRGWAVPNAATDPVAQHVVYADEGSPGKIQWKATCFMLFVR